MSPPCRMFLHKDKRGCAQCTRLPYSIVYPLEAVVGFSTGFCLLARKFWPAVVAIRLVVTNTMVERCLYGEASKQLCRRFLACMPSLLYSTRLLVKMSAAEYLKVATLAVPSTSDIYSVIFAQRRWYGASLCICEPERVCKTYIIPFMPWVMFVYSWNSALDEPLTGAVLDLTTSRTWTQDKGLLIVGSFVF